MPKKVYSELLTQINPELLKKQFRIYVITNNINNYKYVGKESGRPHQRWYLHMYEAKAGKTNLLARAIREFGLHNFTIDYIYQSDSEDDIKHAERKYINELKSHYKNGNGYNMTTGSQGGTRWTKSEVIKFAKMFPSRGAWDKGHNQSYCAARRFRWVDDPEVTGHMPVPSTYTIASILAAAQKYKSPYKWKQSDRKTYDAARQRNILNQCTAHMKRSPQALGRPVIADEDEFFPKISEFCKKYNLSRGNAGLVLLGQRKTVGGHKLRFAMVDEIRKHGLNPDQYLCPDGSDIVKPNWKYKRKSKKHI